MASSFRQWESDPLFSAAEIVQDSADRMDTIFRLLMHEQCLVQGNYPDTKLLKSIEYYKRDLATAVETAKWQLEDFEREVNLSATMDKSHARENVISRHKQFVRAIREQILDVENTLRHTSAGYSSQNGILNNTFIKENERVTLHEPDTNGLESFLSGERVNKSIPIRDIDDSNSMIRFLNPNLDNEIIEHNHEDNKLDFIEASCSLRDAPYDTNGNTEGGCWDLEANEANSRSYFDESRSKGNNIRMKIFGFLPALWFTYGSRASRSFIKRWKDGEELTKSQYHALQGNCRQLSLNCMYNHFQAFYSDLLTRIVQSSRWINQYSVRCRRSPYYSQAKGYSMLLIPAIILTLLVLGILLL